MICSDGRSASADSGPAARPIRTAAAEGPVTDSAAAICIAPRPFGVRLVHVYNPVAMSGVDQIGDRARRYTRASEVGQYAYCARAWWLGYVRGVRPSNVRELQAGQSEHRHHGRQVLAYHRLRRAGYALALAALLLGVLVVWTMVRA